MDIGHLIIETAPSCEDVRFLVDRLPSRGLPPRAPLRGSLHPSCAVRLNAIAGAPWPKRLRRWLAGVRQVVETVYEKLYHTFRLDRERPHDLCGFQARLAAQILLHNFCIWLHEHLGRPRLAFADSVAW